MERGKYERKLGRRLFGWKRGDEGFWWSLGVFFPSPPKSYLYNLKRFDERK